MIRKFFKNRKKFSSGFTLVETLVAISIFSMSILALLSILSQGISSTNYAKKKMIAAYLAQEGIEYIRNMRDTYVLYNSSNSGWLAFANKLKNPPANCDGSNGCYFGDLSVADFSNQSQPIINLAVTACGASCPALLYDSATGKYGYTSGVNSGYTRKINMTQTSSDEVKISSTVFWSQGSGTYSIVFSESLFNWVE